MRKSLAEKWLKGRGVEIGGLHAPVPLPHGVEVTYVDHPDVATNHPDKIAEMKVSVVYDDAQYLEKFEAATQDFVIACHVLEHCDATIVTLNNWARVLKPGGIAMIALPDAKRCFDRNRSLTPWAHLVADYLAVTPDNLEHYIDWFEKSELENKPWSEAVRLAVSARSANRNIHFHCWDETGILVMFQRQEEYSGLKLIQFERNGSELIAILRKDSL